MTTKIHGISLVIVLAVSVSWVFDANAQTVTNLWSFSGGGDGAGPAAGLALGKDGDLYGTTVRGGANNSGTVFRISPSGNLTNLWSFTGGTDGSYPKAGLVQGADGNFYGTTLAGGTSTNCPAGCGTVFQITPSGSLTTLHSFNRFDGAYPSTGLAKDSYGYYYGTTRTGAASFWGSVYRISPNGSLTTLHSFRGNPDGGNPEGTLVQGSDGNFYGMTLNGGEIGQGSVFRISPSGNLTTLWSFTLGADGGSPWAGLVQGSDGDFYGTTSIGGAHVSFGTVFRITRSGSLTTLYSFAAGAQPRAGLVQGKDGYFYGTTATGGRYGGTVFRISSTGSLTILWSADHPGDGGITTGDLVQGNDGNFYGTTSSGGAHNAGTVFKLKVPLNPQAD